MNARSSRAHTVFALSLTQRRSINEAVLSSKLYLCDLGGSEQVKRSKVDNGGYDAATGTALGFQLGDRGAMGLCPFARAL